MQSSFADTILFDKLNSNQPIITEKITWSCWSIFDFGNIYCHIIY